MTIVAKYAFVFRSNILPLDKDLLLQLSLWKVNM